MNNEISLKITNLIDVKTLTDEGIQYLKRKLFSGNSKPTDDDFLFFLSVAKQHGLNPFLNEIYLIPFKGGKWSTYVSARGLEKIARENADFDGMESGVELGKDGIPLKGWCKIYRKSWSRPLSVEVFFKEYYKPPTKDGTYNIWDEKSCEMIEKVAIIKAIRKAFGETANLYAEEEMDVIENPIKSLNKIPQQNTEIDEKAKVWKSEKAILQNQGLDKTQIEKLFKVYFKKSYKDTTIEELRGFANRGIIELEKSKQPTNKKYEARLDLWNRLCKEYSESEIISVLKSMSINDPANATIQDLETVEDIIKNIMQNNDNFNQADVDTTPDTNTVDPF